MRAWWRRQRFALAVCAALLAIAAAASLSINVPGYLASHPSQPRDVPAGSTAHYAGLDVRLEDRRVIPADTAKGRALEVPAGTELVVVTLRIDPSSAPKQSSICTVAVVEPTGAGDRVWEFGFSAPGLYEVPEKDEPACTATRGAPYTMQAAVLLPAGAAARSLVRLSVSSALPSALILH